MARMVGVVLPIGTRETVGLEVVPLGTDTSDVPLRRTMSSLVTSIEVQITISVGLSFKSVRI